VAAFSVASVLIGVAMTAWWHARQARLERERQDQLLHPDRCSVAEPCRPHLPLQATLTPDRAGVGEGTEGNGVTRVRSSRSALTGRPPATSAGPHGSSITPDGIANLLSSWPMSQSTDPIAAAYEGARISLALGIGVQWLSGPLLEHDLSP
jgi:hypothetical protein